MYTLYNWNNLVRSLIRGSSVSMANALRTGQFGGRIQAWKMLLLNGYRVYFLGLTWPWLDIDKKKFLLSTGLKWVELYNFSPLCFHFVDRGFMYFTFYIAPYVYRRNKVIWKPPRYQETWQFLKEESWVMPVFSCTVHELNHVWFNKTFLEFRLLVVVMFRQWPN